MDENKQILMFIRRKGDCIFDSTDTDNGCWNCIADTACCTEEEDVTTLTNSQIRLNFCISLGIQRGLLIEEEVFEAMI